MKMDTKYQNLWDPAKVVLKGKVLADIYTKKNLF